MRTEQTLEVPKGNVIKKVQVLRFQDFKIQYKSLKDSFPHLVDVPIGPENLDDVDVYFFR